MSTRTATTVNFDYQSRALEFRVDDWVAPIGADETDVGRVVEVWPGLGVVDVEWATGNRRMNVEDIIIVDRDGVAHPPETTNNMPGGPPVRPGRNASAKRVGSAFLKNAIYWATRNRGYRATKSEIANRTYHCPRCPEASPMNRCTYKMEDRCKHKLLACPNCMYMIKISDIQGHHQNIPEPEPEEMV